MTKPAESTGRRTPAHFCRDSGPSFRPSPLLLYGGPYVALVELPASSAAAVVIRSLGAAFAQLDIVIEFSSGEEKIAASPPVSTTTTTRAMTNSLTRS